MIRCFGWRWVCSFKRTYCKNISRAQPISNVGVSPIRSACFSQCHISFERLSSQVSFLFFIFPRFLHFLLQSPPPFFPPFPSPLSPLRAGSSLALCVLWPFSVCLTPFPLSQAQSLVFSLSLCSFHPAHPPLPNRQPNGSS